MTRLVPLHNDQHRSLRIHPGHGIGREDHAGLCPVVLAELAAAAADFPLFLGRERETGAFDITAVMGFADGGNLYLDGATWTAEHKPLHLQRQPFYAHAGEDGVQMFVDLDSPRAGRSGEPLFTPGGQPEPYLEYVHSVLAELLAGLGPTRAFATRVLDLGLAEPAALPGLADELFTIRREALAALPDATVLDLFRLGDLERIHLMIASLAHLPGLFRRWEERSHNEKTAAQG